MGRVKEQDRVRVENAEACPFCGCSAVSTQRIAGLYYAGCDSCYAGAKWSGDRQVAIDNWNRRVLIGNRQSVDSEKRTAAK